MTDVEAKGYGVLSDETFVQARKRIGIPQRLPNPPHNYEVTWDGSRLWYADTEWKLVSRILDADLEA